MTSVLTTTDAATTASAPLISMTDVCKTYEAGEIKVDALSEVNLTVGGGDYVAIMGPSGSGKSTLMHILGCLDVPTSGRYLLNGTDVSAMNEKQLAHVRNAEIGFVFQQFNLLASETALRNVELPLMYAGVRPAERHQRALEALDRVGLADRVKHRRVSCPAVNSSGSRSPGRWSPTRPAARRRADGNLDSVSTKDVLNLLDELHGQGRTIVLIARA